MSGDRSLTFRLRKLPWHNIALGLILLAAAGLRLTGLAWDDYHQFHPDERYIAWVGTSIHWPDELSNLLRPHQTSLNPYYWPADADTEGVVVPQASRRDFAYGHLPLYLGVAFTQVAAQVGQGAGSILPASWRLTQDLMNRAGHIPYDHITIAGRVLTALVDTLSVAVTYLIARRLYERRTALLAALLLAFSLLHIQFAHFFASDPYLTLFSLLAIFAMVRAIDNPRWFWPAAAFIGLAAGSKSAGIFLLVPLIWVLWQRSSLSTPDRLKWLAACGGVALAAFAVTNPFALLDFSCQAISPRLQLGPVNAPAIDWKSCFLYNMFKQGGIVSGAADIGFARQYTGTVPILYLFEMLFKWGLGPFVTVAGVAGALWTGWLWLRQQQEAVSKGQKMVLVWLVVFMLLTGSSFVKFPRYWLPITPLLVIFAAALLSRRLRLVPRARQAALVAFFAAPGVLMSLAFMTIYIQPHPWVSASLWIFANAPPESVIHMEQWDEQLPTSLEVGGEFHSRLQYEQQELTWLTGPDQSDNLQKLEENLMLLSQADYLTIASNRVYGVVPRLPDRYPLSSQYHQLLFAGDLGFDVVYVNSRFPRLGPLSFGSNPFDWPRLQPPSTVGAYLADNPTLNLGRLDESLTVYDQPLAIILVNQDHLSPPEMLQQFDLQP